MASKKALVLVIVSTVWLWALPGLGDGDAADESPAAPPSASDVVETGAIEEIEPGSLEPQSLGPQAASPLPDGFVPGSSYGYRTSPRTGDRTFHAGLDFLAPRGTEVRAVRGGIVERVTEDRVGRTRFGGYGTAVVISHPEVQRWTFYAHLDSVDVTVGQTVRVGEPIGTVGNSTNHRFPGMTCHLHLEVRSPGHGGRSPFPAPYRRFNVDPRAWLASLGVHFGERRQHSARLDLATSRR